MCLISGPRAPEGNPTLVLAAPCPHTQAVQEKPLPAGETWRWLHPTPCVPLLPEKPPRGSSATIKNPKTLCGLTPCFGERTGLRS